MQMKRYLSLHHHEVIVVLALIVGLNLAFDSMQHSFYMGNAEKGILGGCSNIIMWHFPRTQQIPYFRLWELSFSILLIVCSIIYALRFERKLKQKHSEPCH